MCILKNLLVKMFICRKGHKNTYMKIITRILTPTEKLLLNSLCIAAWAPVTSIKIMRKRRLRKQSTFCNPTNGFSGQ